MLRKLQTIAALTFVAFSGVFVISATHAQERTKTVMVPPHQHEQIIYQPTYTIGVQAVSTGSSVEVVSVFSGSPASRLLLESGDRIVSINGNPVRNIAELQSQLAHAANYHNGQIRVLIDNVRARAGEYGAQRWVTHSTYLNGFPMSTYPQNQFNGQVYQQQYVSPPVVVTSGH